MVKIYMTSGTILYRNDASIPANDQVQAFRTYVNSSNSRGASCITAYKDQALTQPVVMVLQNVEYFEEI